MAEDILHHRRQEQSSDNLDYDQSIFDKALCELKKEVETLSGKTLKDFGFILKNRKFLNYHHHNAQR